MNMALAADEAQYGYGRNINVEDAMQVLANAGYNADNWVCLTAGYQVYWYEEDNRCILYNSATAEIEYPEEYIGAKTKDGKQNIMLSSYVHIYNENHLKAQQFNMSLGSSVKVDSNGKISSTGISGSGSDVTYAISSTTTTVGGEVISSATLSSASALKALAGEDAQAIIKSALGIEGSVQEIKDTPIYMYATKESISADTTGAYASLQISSVGTEPTLENSGEVKENLYYLSIVDNNGTSEQLSAAKQAAAQYVYNIFDQITEGKIDDNVTIIVAPGTELDCFLGGADWAPCKTFEGYFGTPTGSITINGANLTTKTGFSQTVQLTGSNSKYFLTGFFGTVYGNTTIENVNFKNINIKEPATDYELLYGSKAEKKDPTGGTTASRNTVGIIGGITDGAIDRTSGHPANVVLRNITVDSSCSIIGAANAGGLVGYIGSTNVAKNLNDSSFLTGTILIDNCKVAATVESLDNDGISFNAAGYGACGGIVGFVCRADGDGTTKTQITINDCEFTGSINGYKHIAGIVDQVQAGDVKLTGTIKVSASFNTKQNLAKVYYDNNYQNGYGPAYGATISSSNPSRINISEATFDISSSMPAFINIVGNSKPLNISYYKLDNTTWTAE